MRKSFFISAVLFLMLGAGVPSALAQNSSADVATLQATAPHITDIEAINRTQLIVEEVIKASYPELKSASIHVQTFHSASDYFRTSFSFGRFLSAQKMRYFIKVNPQIFELNAPEEGMRAIIAHELGHAFDFHRKKRICLLGLVRLSSKGYTATFERRTDLQAISRSYSEGLKAYRVWL
jgi:multidrug efflux pump subunit AcrB